MRLECCELFPIDEHGLRSALIPRYSSESHHVPELVHNVEHRIADDVEDGLQDHAAVFRLADDVLGGGNAVQDATEGRVVACKVSEAKVSFLGERRRAPRPREKRTNLDLE